MSQPLLLLESPWAGITILSSIKNSEGKIADFLIEQINTTALGQLAYLDIQIGKKFSQVFPLGDELLEMYNKVLETSNPIEYQVCLPHKGTDVWWRNRLFLYNNDALVLISENITVVKNQEAELKDKNALLQSIFDLSWNTFWVLKSIRNDQGELIDFSIKHINKKAKETFPRLHISTLYSECFPGTFDQNFQKLIKVVNTGAGYTEDLFFPHDGINEWLRERVTKFGDGLLITQDFITEDKAKEAQLLSLAQRNEELDTFVYTASHDLSSPVNNMEMLVSQLAKEIKGNSQNSDLYMGLLNKSIIHLKNTLQDLTTVTEIHPGEKKDLVNLNTLIEEVKIALFEQIQAADASLEVDLNIPFLAIPKKHARSLIFNLLSNAIKFRSKERKLVVTITSFRKGERTHLSFSDNGMGIREEDQAKVFLIFKRFNQGITGRGIGMYLVKRVIDLNDGEIHLQSQENVGTTFHIQFPIAT